MRLVHREGIRNYIEDKCIHLAEVHKRVRLFVRLWANAIEIL